MCHVFSHISRFFGLFSFTTLFIPSGNLLCYGRLYFILDISQRQYTASSYPYLFMALPTFNTKSPTIRRILKEATELSKNPDSTLHAAPLEADLFEWHFTIRGPPSTPYAAGAYHGRIVLPHQYPLRPPSFRFLTPSGRFEPNREICLSISGHHEETWQPAWGIRTALWALRAFMEGGAKGQVGGMEMGEAERKRLAEESKSWRCSGCGGRTNDEILKEQLHGHGASSEAAVVPDELKFGYKDEMSNKGSNKHAATTPLEAQGKTEDVAHDSRENQTQLTNKAVHIQTSDKSSTARGTQLQPIPLPNVASSSQQQSHYPATSVQPAAPRESHEPVPGWIDKAIIGVLATLIVMIIKKLLV